MKKYNAPVVNKAIYEVVDSLCAEVDFKSSTDSSSDGLISFKPDNGFTSVKK